MVYSVEVDGIGIVCGHESKEIVWAGYLRTVKAAMTRDSHFMMFGRKVTMRFGTRIVAEYDPEKDENRKASLSRIEQYWALVRLRNGVISA